MLGTCNAALPVDLYTRMRNVGLPPVLLVWPSPLPAVVRRSRVRSPKVSARGLARTHTCGRHAPARSVAIADLRRWRACSSIAMELRGARCRRRSATSAKQPQMRYTRIARHTGRLDQRCAPASLRNGHATPARPRSGAPRAFDTRGARAVGRLTIALRPHVGHRSLRWL